MFKENSLSKKSASVKENRSPAVNLVFGIWAAYAITAIVFIAYALLLTYTGVTEKNMQLIVILTTVISVAVAGFDAAKGVKTKGWLWGMAAGFAYALTLIIINAIVVKQLAFGGSTLTILLISISGGTLGGMLGINTKKS